MSSADELHPPEKITSLYLVRHGHTRATELGLLYSNHEIELTEKGHKQAKIMAHHLPRYKADLLLTSSARRVLETAQPIAQLLDLEAQILDDFNEWQVGLWEGRTYLDIKKNSPEQYQQWCADPINNAPPEGESIKGMTERIKTKLHALLAHENYVGKKIVMVSHSGIIRTIIMEALEMKVENFWRLNIPTGSVSRVDFSASFATVHFMALCPAEPGP
jgi:broad specificity phosphatase PhoE